MKKGRCETMTHDDKRHGTTTLFVALDVATGEVIGKTYRKHRHQEVLKFLREVDKAVPREQEIHIVLDNYATHKYEKVLAWIERKKRIFLFFIPTSTSWPDLVERFFAILTQKQVRRDVFTSVPQLERCLRDYLLSHNENHALSSGRRLLTKSLRKFTGVARLSPKSIDHYFAHFRN